MFFFISIQYRSFFSVYTVLLLIEKTMKLPTDLKGYCKIKLLNIHVMFDFVTEEIM